MSDPQHNTFAQQREQMVQEQLEGRDITNTAILTAFRTVPRHVFVPKAYQHMAYDDTPLPIPDQQTISQPYIVAHMLVELALHPTDTILEIGTGSGYAAALLSQIVQTVYTVERHQHLADYAQKRFTHLHYTNIHIHVGDGTLGWPQHAPYQAIIVAAGGPTVPPTLRQQLAIGGRLIMPVGNKKRKQYLIRVTRHTQEQYTSEKRTAVAFVPLIGQEGW